MTTNMPGSLDAFVDPGPNDNMITVSHRAQHDNVNDGLAAVEKIVVGPVVFNVKGYGAKGDGATDDTVAIQAAITAAGTAGGVVLFPAGAYRTTATLTQTANAHVTLQGCGYLYVSGTAPAAVFAGTAILWDSPNTVIDVIHATAGRLTVKDLGIIPYSGPASSGGGYVAIHTTVDTEIIGVTTSGISGTGLATTGVLADGAPACRIHDCTLAAWTNAVWMKGGQILTVSDSTLSTAAGTGGGNIRMGNGAQTLRVRNSQSQGGDRGFYMVDDGGSAPAFAWFYDYEVNNPQVAGFDLVNGSQVYATAVWLSAAGDSTDPAVGLNVESTFGGNLYFAESDVQSFGSGNILVSGGQGIVIADCEIGGAGAHTANTYDDVQIAGGSHVSIHGCHIGVDPYYDGNSNARYGLNVAAALTAVTEWGNDVGTGYATASRNGVPSSLRASGGFNATASASTSNHDGLVVDSSVAYVVEWPGVAGHAVGGAPDSRGGNWWHWDSDGTADAGLWHGGLLLNNGSPGLFGGSGAPAIAGAVGDYYLRTDTPSTANQRVYVCTVAGGAGVATWAGIL